MLTCGIAARCDTHGRGWAFRLVTAPLSNFDPVLGRLARVLADSANGMSYADDGGRPRLEVPGLEGNPQGAVAQISIRRRYVAYVLVPVYLMPDLLDGISDALRRTFHGKAVFRFTAIDEGLMEELGRLTKTSVERYRPYAEVKLARAAERRLPRRR